VKLEHRFVVPAPVEQTWAAFNDLERVVPCFPGATLTSYDGDDFTGSCKVKLGPVSLQYSGTGTFVERDESGHHAVIEAKGKDRRGNGTATARVTARLTGTSGGDTEVTVDTDLTITGRPAQFGRGLIQDVSNKFLDQFTTCLKTKLNEPAAAGTSTGKGAGAGTGKGADDASAGGRASAGPSAGERAGAGTSTSTGEGEGAGPGTGAGDGASAGGSASAGPSAGERAGAGADANAGEGVSAAAGVSSEDGAGGERSAAGSARADRPSTASPLDSSAEADEVVLDLGSTLLPMLAKRAAPYLIGAVFALVLRRLFRR
jgi:carbon monoxide dehydrogenase subunit G